MKLTRDQSSWMDPTGVIRLTRVSLRRSLDTAFLVTGQIILLPSLAFVTKKKWCGNLEQRFSKRPKCKQVGVAPLVARPPPFSLRSSRAALSGVDGASGILFRTSWRLSSWWRQASDLALVVTLRSALSSTPSPLEVFFGSLAALPSRLGSNSVLLPLRSDLPMVVCCLMFVVAVVCNTILSSTPTEQSHRVLLRGSRQIVSQKSSKSGPANAIRTN